MSQLSTLARGPYSVLVRILPGSPQQLTPGQRDQQFRLVRLGERSQQFLSERSCGPADSDLLGEPGQRVIKIRHAAPAAGVPACPAPGCATRVIVRHGHTVSQAPRPCRSRAPTCDTPAMTGLRDKRALVT